MIIKRKHMLGISYYEKGLMMNLQYVDEGME